MKVFNHTLHIILDICTCGFWLPIHLIAWAMAPTVPIQHTVQPVYIQPPVHPGPPATHYPSQIAKPPSPPVMSSSRCSGCGGSVSGVSGSVVRCQHCDSEMKLD